MNSSDFEAGIARDGRQIAPNAGDQAYQSATWDVIYLIGCAVKGVIPDAERVHAMNLDDLYRVAEWHNLAAITAMALESAGVHDRAFIQARGKSIRKMAAMDADMAALFMRLDSAGIWYMPLKGSILKDIYPAYGMRQMSDRDILFDANRAKDVKAIMEDMGFTCAEFGKTNHDVYTREPVSSFEMHRTLFKLTHGEKLYAYYRDVEAKLLPGPGHSRHFTNEDLYIYITAHEYKHYASKGTGLRTILDTFVFLNKYSDVLNWTYIAGELEKLGIAEYERQKRSLALSLFGGKTLTIADEAMLQYIIDSGTYGSFRNYIGNGIRKQGGHRKGKLKYLMNRIIMPLDKVRIYYPFFYRHKVLLPTLCVWRILKGLTFHSRESLTELKALIKHKSE